MGKQDHKMSRRKLLTTMGVTGAAVVAGGLAYSFNENVSKSYAQINDLNNQIDETIHVVKPVDGVTEYSAILNEATQNHSHILIKNGHYPVDVTLMKRLKSNTMIRFEPNAWLKVLPNSLERYALLDMTNVSNVFIYNPNLEGDKYEHTGTAGQWGHGMNVVESQNIKIYNARSNKFWGDGLYIRGAKDVEVHHSLFDDNRRQGISIIFGENLLINRVTCSNTGGHAPGAGIDIECNYPGEYLRNVNIIEPRLINNGHQSVYDYAMAISLGRHFSLTQKTDVSIKVINPIMENCSLVIGTRVGSQGEINVINPVISNTRKNALYILGCDSKDLQINIENPTIINPHRIGEGGIYSNGIAMEEKMPTSDDYQGMQNISIKNPVLRNTDNDCYAIRLIGKHPNNYKNCEIINPDIAGDFTVDFSAFWGGNTSKLDPSFRYTVDEHLTPRSIAHNGTITNNFHHANVSYSGTEANGGDIYLTDGVPVTNVELRIENQSKANKPLRLHFGTSASNSPKNVYPLSAVAIKGIELSTKYSFIKLKKISETEFVIVASSGNVTAITN